MPLLLPDVPYSSILEEDGKELLLNADVISATEVMEEPTGTSAKIIFLRTLKP